MSADNQIVILETKGEFRVEHVSAFDNVYWSHVHGLTNSAVSARLVEYFSGSKVFKDKSTALESARKMYDKEGYLEYGIVFFPVNKTWITILKEAREELTKEKEYVLSLSDTEMRAEIKENILQEINHSYSDVLNHLVRHGRK